MVENTATYKMPPMDCMFHCIGIPRSVASDQHSPVSAANANSSAISA